MAKAHRKEMILRAATDCFAKYGYGKTTLDNVGALVGLNKASLYYYYKSKESLFCDVIFRETEIFLDELHSKISQASTTEEKILKYLDERINYYKKVVNLHNLALDTVRKVEPVFFDVYDKLLVKEAEYLEGLIESGIREKEFKQADAKVIAQSIIEVSAGVRYRQVHISSVKMAGEADFLSIMKKIRVVVELILDGIKK
jgi:AcrR family transcriptional regulator